MSGVYYREYENGEWKNGGSPEEETALFPAAATFPQVKISDRYTGRHRWTGLEMLRLALVEDPSPKK